MDIGILKDLASNQTLRLGELKTSKPAAFAAVTGEIGAERRSVLDALTAVAPDAVKRVVAGLEPAKLGGDDAADVLAGALEQAGVDPGVRGELLSAVAASQAFSPTSVDPDLPVGAHPAIQRELGRAELASFLEAAKVPAAAAATLAGRVPDLATLDDAALGDLVASNALADADARALGVRVALFHATGGQPAAAQALAGTRFDALGRPPQSARELLQVSPKDLAGALRAANVAPPAGVSLGDFVTTLQAKVAEAYPFDALRVRFGTPAPDAVAQSALSLAPVLTRDPQALAKDFSAIDTSALSPDERAKAQAAHAAVAPLVRRYPGLGLEAALRGGSAAEVAKNVAARLGLVDAVVKQNPAVEFLALDYAPDSADMQALKTAGLADADRAAVLKTFKAQQRVFAAVDDADLTARVLEAGYPSAAAIARDDVDEFARKSGLPAEKAQAIHARASNTLAGVSAIVGSIIDVVKGGFDRFGVGNLFEDVSDGLRKMDGYADLFGPVDGCNCSSCQSILSPAAYFVDLMRFIEEHVSQVVFTGSKVKHALHLLQRRPDLWTLPLTCENTNTLLPTLVVVNEILETYVAQRIPPSVPGADRKAIEARVYGTLLPAQTASFQTPFVLGAVKADVYLEAFEQTRAAIVAAAGRAGTAQEAAARLRLAPQEYAVIVTPNTAAAYLQQLYRVTFAFGAGGVAAPVDVQDLLPGAGLTRADLGSLAASRTVTAGGARNVRIQPEKRSPQSVQNDVERVSGLTADALDAMNRMSRLWRAVGWTVPELDLALSQRAPGAAPPLDPAAVADVAATAQLAGRFGVSVEEACALWGGVSRTVLVDGQPSLWDRLFNSRPYVLSEGTLPRDAVAFVHPAFRADATPRPADNTLQRLVLGCKISEAELGDLIRLLAPALGANLAAPSEDDRGFLLTEANLSLLYRHARLVKLLRRSVAELGQVLAFAGVPGGVRGLSDVQTVLAFDDWARASGWSLDDLAFATGGAPLQPGRYPDAAQVAAAVVDALAAEGALVFADTVFAFVPGVTEDDSRRLVAANAALFEAQPQNALRLAASTPLAPALAIPAGITAPAGDLQAALARHHAGSILPVRIAARLGVTVEKLAALARLLGLDLSGQTYVVAAQGGARADLESAIRALARLAVALGADDLGGDRLAFLGAHLALFGIADVRALTVPNLRALSGYRRLVAPQPPPDPAHAPRPEAVEAALAQFTPAQKFGPAPAQTLGDALGVPAPVATTLASFAVLGGDALPALGTLAALAQLSVSTGIGADALKLLVSETAAELDRGAEALVAALRQKFPDDKDFTPRLEPLDNRLHGRKRDALADYVIRNSHERFTSLDDLYDYFLIDPQLQGCARTSRVVAAISSAQAYVHRVLLDLEQDRRDVNDPDHVHVLPSLVPADEWTWRKNYRVWEANRKVFLWPENYLEPQLRDDKTPLFKGLEDTLLQQDVDEQNVLDAYGAYLSGFEEVAGLHVAGAYHELDWTAGKDVVHLFGATHGDPPTYYYWTIENLYYGALDPERQVTYSARRKIDVSIPARSVTPIVYLGRLFLFWNEISTLSWTEVKGGESKFKGYKHKTTTKFVSLRLDGSWTPPQVLELLETTPFGSGGIVYDPLTYRGGYNSWNFGVPYHSTGTAQHTEFQDGYTLRGFGWEDTFPAAYGDRLITVSGGLYSSTEADLFDRKQRSLSGALRSSLGAIWSGGRRMLHVGRAGSERRLYVPWMTNSFGWYTLLPPNAVQALVADIDGFQDFFLSWNVWSNHLDTYLDRMSLSAAKRGGWIATLSDNGARASAVLGAPSGAGLIIQTGADAAYVHRVPSWGLPRFSAVRLGTTLARRLSRTLFTGGVNELLSLETQRSLAEAPHLVQPTHWTLQNRGRAGAIDFRGPMGVYYREIFFHIPLLIAVHLNERQNFAAAQSWFHYAFDPTAALEPGTSLAGLGAGQQQKVLRDRVWRYLEFRNLTPPTLREILGDQAAIRAYKEDPFNPHAIARLRISAYQKNVVMKYVSNLIDWGDSLFRQFTMESVNEAQVLYVMASEILGRPPADVGSCGEGALSPKTYQTVKPTLERGSEFLLEAETVFWVGPRADRFARLAGGVRKYVDYVRTDGEIRLQGAVKVAAALGQVRPAPAQPAPRPLPRPLPFPGIDLALTPLRATVAGAVGAAVTTAAAATPSSLGMAQNSQLREAAPVGQLRAEFQDAPQVLSSLAGSMVAEAAVTRTSVERLSPELRAVAVAVQGQPATISRQIDWKKTRAVSWTTARDRLVRVVGNDSILIDDFRRVGRFGWGIVRQLGPVFCVPQNKDLTDLWGRVDDRLYKIRHCLDIDGQRRDLALFAPEIDPRLLVRARAEGLSIEDVLGAGSGNLPPYRFLYLIDKARQYVAAVQSFGAQLLSALEKRDGEELTRLRNTQAMNMAKMTTRLREWELKIAEDSFAQVERQISAVEYRRDYYRGLIENDLLPWERTQQALRHGSTAFYTLGSLFGGTAGVLSLLPQLGSPFAMKYGGLELGNSFKGWSMCFSDTAKLLDVFAASAGLEASFERRREGWDHQAKLADQELKQLEKARSIAQTRVDIATRALELHQKSLDDQDEIIAFFNEKFTGLGLYTWTSTTLQRLYRQSFNAAQAMARLAERAYRFERGDEVTPLLQANYWDAPHAGLLAGERLAADLADMEKRFIETNYRKLEIDQSFSLGQLDPAQLLALRQNGECEFAVPERAFDLFYPGHYRRRIRAARLTLPCITGPYTNVPVTLTLKQSFVRKEPATGAANLVEVPLRHTSTVATSTAQNDAGVFDFSFRDERYMPFEGAGAVSVWSISLPRTFRPMDYQAITDVVLHLSYDALLDGALRAKVETDNAALEGTIAKALSDTPLGRVLSLRQDFSSVFKRLCSSAPNTQVPLELDDRILPFFLRLRPLRVVRALLLLRTGGGASAAGTTVQVDGKGVTGFSTTPEFPGWRSADAMAALGAGLTGNHALVVTAPGDLAPAAGDPAAFDAGKLLDLALYVEVGL